MPPLLRLPGNVPFWLLLVVLLLLCCVNNDARLGDARPAPPSVLVYVPGLNVRLTPAMGVAEATLKSGTRLVPPVKLNGVAAAAAMAAAVGL